jgi:hypothetical protein
LLFEASFYYLQTMFSFFKTIPVHLKIFPDRMELINLQSGQEVSGTPLQSFSSERLLIADYNSAETLARQLALDLGVQKKRLKVLVQPMKIERDGISTAEKRTLRDLAEQIGAKEVLIVTEERQVLRDDALQIMKEL